MATPAITLIDVFPLFVFDHDCSRPHQQGQCIPDLKFSRLMKKYKLTESPAYWRLPSRLPERPEVSKMILQLGRQIQTEKIRFSWALALKQSDTCNANSVRGDSRIKKVLFTILPSSTNSFFIL